MIDYDRNNWWRITFSFRGTALTVSWSRVAICVAYSLLVQAVYETGTDLGWVRADQFLGIDPAGHAVLGSLIGFLIVFRINASNARYWEGRSHWGSLINTSRNLVRFGTQYTRAGQELADLVTGYVICLRRLLQGKRDLEEADVYLPEHVCRAAARFGNPPTAVAGAISAVIGRLYAVGGVGFDSDAAHGRIGESPGRRSGGLREDPKDAAAVCVRFNGEAADSCVFGDAACGAVFALWLVVTFADGRNRTGNAGVGRSQRRDRRPVWHRRQLPGSVDLHYDDCAGYGTVGERQVGQQGCGEREWLGGTGGVRIKIMEDPGAGSPGVSQATQLPRESLSRRQEISPDSPLRRRGQRVLHRLVVRRRGQQVLHRMVVRRPGQQVLHRMAVQRLVQRVLHRLVVRRRGQQVLHRLVVQRLVQRVLHRLAVRRRGQRVQFAVG